MLSLNLKIKGTVKDADKFKKFFRKRFGDKVDYKTNLILPEDGEAYTLLEVDRTFYDKVLAKRFFKNMGDFRMYQLIDNEDATTTFLQRELENVEATLMRVLKFPDEPSDARVSGV